MRGGVCMVLQERDKQIFRELNRWRFCLSRHIRELCEFPTECALYLLQKTSMSGEMKLSDKLRSSHPNLEKRIERLENWQDTQDGDNINEETDG